MEPIWLLYIMSDCILYGTLKNSPLFVNFLSLIDTWVSKLVEILVIVSVDF